MTLSDPQIQQLLTASGARPHPVVALPTPDQVRALLAHAGGQGRLRELLEQRQNGIRLMEEDPLKYGYEPDWWKDCRREIAIPGRKLGLVLGGNDSTKTWFMMKYGVERMVAEPGIDWLFGHNTEDSSKEQQQGIVWQFLPPEWRNLGKVGQHINVSYKASSGFTNNAFILPNGSRGFFKFYKQETGVLVGKKLRGACCDELITQAFLEELETRMLGRDGFILVGFTPVDGYTPVVASIIAGHEVREYRPSKYLPGNNLPNNPSAPKGHMPYLLTCRNRAHFALCAFTEWSPFRKLTTDGRDQIEVMIEGKPISYVKVRAYGWPEKQQGTAIGKFSSVHIIRRAEGAAVPVGPVPPSPWKAGNGVKCSVSSVQALNTENLKLETAPYPSLGMVGTNYRVVDPGGSKNWFIKWYRITPNGFIHLYREWPDQNTHGEWAVAGDKHDGCPGPAQRSAFGRGIIDYKRLMLECEGWIWNEERGWISDDAEPIFESYIDPRMGGAEVPSEEEGTSIIALLEQEQTDTRGRIVGPSMMFEGAPGGSGSIANQAGIMMLNDWFDYDPQQPISVLNCPRFYVVEDCQQSIFAYRTYTGLDGEKGALKDVMDPDWYLRKVDPEHHDPTKMKATAGGSY